MLFAWHQTMKVSEQQMKLFQTLKAALVMAENWQFSTSNTGNAWSSCAADAAPHLKKTAVQKYFGFFCMTWTTKRERAESVSVPMNGGCEAEKNQKSEHVTRKKNQESRTLLNSQAKIFVNVSFASPKHSVRGILKEPLRQQWEQYAETFLSLCSWQQTDESFQKVCMKATESCNTQPFLFSKMEMLLTAILISGEHDVWYRVGYTMSSQHAYLIPNFPREKMYCKRLCVCIFNSFLSSISISWQTWKQQGPSTGSGFPCWYLGATLACLLSVWRSSGNRILLSNREFADFTASKKRM